MIFYIATASNQELIGRAILEAKEIGTCEERTEAIFLKKYIRENISKMESIDSFLVDLNAVQDNDDEIIEAFEMLKIIGYRIRIIVLASNRIAGDGLLQKCFNMGIYDLILTDGFSQLYEEVKICITEGKQYKDALQFKEGVSKDRVIVKKEITRTVNKIMIGIAGAQERIGCTHFSIVLANYLRKQNYLVAVVEYGERNTFQTMREAFSENLLDEQYFILNGVNYYENIQLNGLQRVLNKFYNFIIIDFGKYSDVDFIMYEKCDIKMLVAGAKPWETENLSAIFEETDMEQLKNMKFIFNFVEEGNQEDIRKEMAGLDNVFFLPITIDPFTEKDIGSIDKIFDFYKPESKEPEDKKKGTLFNMLKRRKPE